MRKEHCHDFYSVILFTAGNGTISINNKSHKVLPQTVVLVAPNQVHSFEGLEEMKGVVLFFCQDFYVEEFSFMRLLNVFSCTTLLSGNNCNPCIDLAGKEFGTVSGLMESIDKEYESYTPSSISPIIIRSLLNILLLRLSELYFSNSERSNAGESLLVHQLSSHIDSYFIKEHNIGFYTSSFNISEKQLNDICHRHFNCGLKKILIDRLMQEARKLLMSSGLSVSEISYKLNFEDNSYFNKVFKKQTGLTPKRFRDIHKRLIP